MFARKISLNLKPNTHTDFTRKVEADIVPVLRKQKGFQEQFFGVLPNSNEAISISLWDQKENAELFNRSTYPELMKVLSPMVEGTPTVHSFEVHYTRPVKTEAPVAVKA